MPIFNALKPLIKIMNSLFSSIIRLPFARKTWVRGGILFSLVLSTGVLFGCKTPIQTAALNAAKGQEELSCRFDEISLFNGGYLIKKDNFFGLYSASGDIIVPCEFDQICFFNGDYRVNKGKYFGLYSTNGDIIIPCEFNQISLFNGDYLVKKGNKQSLYNADGQEILP